MKKKTITIGLLASAITLSGCTDGRVTLEQLQFADDVCKNNQGIKEVSFIGRLYGYSDKMKGYTIFCNDGAEFDYQKQRNKLNNK